MYSLMVRHEQDPRHKHRSVSAMFAHTNKIGLHFPHNLTVQFNNCLNCDLVYFSYT